MNCLRQVRAGLALALVLVTGVPIPALAAAWNNSSASADASLPACCRRHGSHHCPMMDSGAMAKMAAMADHSHARVHAVCTCGDEDAAQAATGAMAWVADQTLQHILLLSERVRISGSRRVARDGERRLWRERGPPRCA